MALGLGGTLLVTGLLAYALLRTRKHGDELPRQTTGDRRLELIWTVIPALVLISVFAYTIVDMSTSPTPGPGLPEGQQPDVIVTGYQYWWRYEYPPGRLHAQPASIVTANELHIPVGRRILVQLEADLVQHDYWIPQLGKKFDMYPGKTNHLWLEAKEPGEYEGVCAEYCGHQHAYMRILAIAEPQDQFEAWAAAHLSSEPPSPPAQAPRASNSPSYLKQPETDSPILANPIPADVNEQARLAAQGRQLFGQLACGTCHAIAGTEWQAQAGPSLTAYSQRRIISSGVMHHTPKNLAIYLKNPQAIKPGIYMPNYRLSA